MGRLSQYINSKGGGSGYVEVSGFAENDAMLGRLMTSDPEMVRYMRKLIRRVLKAARNKLSEDAVNFLKNDPRKAAKAVRFSVYKTLFGGNISILQKRKAGKLHAVRKKRKLDMNPNQRGGNRIPRDRQRSRLDYYYGADRGFILRFLSTGTQTRRSRFGNRGYIRRTDWFGHTAPWHIEAAANEFAHSISMYIKKETNG